MKLDKILLWILRGGLVLALFSVFIRSYDFFFPYIFPRTAYFQVVIALLFVVAILLVSLYPVYRPKWTLLHTAIAVWFGIMALSTVFSEDPSKSMFGTLERAFGFFNVLHYGILLFIAVIALRTSRQWNTFLAVSVAMSIYAALNLIGPVLLTGYVPETVAGNPTFISAYLIFHIFFALYLFTQTDNKKFKILLGFIAVMQISAVLLSSVRGAFVGLSAAVFFMILYAIWKYKNIRIPLAGGLIIIFLIYGLLFINKGSPFLSNNSLVRRITSFSLSGETIKARFAMWKIAFSGIKDRPILGWGRENYSLVFNTHFDPSFDAAGVGEAWEDRSHNVFFDESVNSGILGLLAYLFLLIAIFISLKARPLFIALLIAYTVQNLTGVDTLNSYLPFFLFIGLSDNKSWRLSEDYRPIYNPPRFKAITAVILSFLIAITSIFFTAQSARGNIVIHKALSSLAVDNYTSFKESYDKGKKILVLFPYLEAEAIVLIASIVDQSAASFSQLANYKNYLNQIIPDLQRITSRNDMEHRFSMMFAGLLIKNAVIDQSYLDRVDGILKKIIGTSTNRKLYIDAVLVLERVRAALAAQRSME